MRGSGLSRCALMRLTLSTSLGCPYQASGQRPPWAAGFGPAPMPGPAPPSHRLSDTPRPRLEPKPHPYLLQRRPQAPPLAPVIPGPALSLSPASAPGPPLCPALLCCSVPLLSLSSPPPQFCSCCGSLLLVPATPLISQPGPARLLFLFVLPHSPFSSARLFALPWLHSSICPLQSLLPPSTITSVHPG